VSTKRGEAQTSSQNTSRSFVRSPTTIDRERRDARTNITLVNGFSNARWQAKTSKLAQRITARLN